MRQLSPRPRYQVLPMPKIEPTGDTDKIILLAQYTRPSDLIKDTCDKLDILNGLADNNLLSKFEALFARHGI
jgi:hypothetical protein